MVVDMSELAYGVGLRVSMELGIEVDMGVGMRVGMEGGMRVGMGSGVRVRIGTSGIKLEITRIPYFAILRYKNTT